jgi:hypothetical protein
METSIFITDLAQQFSLSVVGPVPLVSSLSGWPEQAGSDFLIFALPSFMPVPPPERQGMSERQSIPKQNLRSIGSAQIIGGYCYRRHGLLSRRR